MSRITIVILTLITIVWCLTIGAGVWGFSKLLSSQERLAVVVADKVRQNVQPVVVPASTQEPRLKTSDLTDMRSVAIIMDNMITRIEELEKQVASDKESLEATQRMLQDVQWAMDMGNPGMKRLQSSSAPLSNLEEETGIPFEGF